MSAPPAGISEADWDATPASVREIVGQVQALRDENDQLRQRLTALANELTELRERMGRHSRNSSKPPSSDSQGYRYAEGFANKPPGRRKSIDRKRGGKQGHPGAGPELLPVERCDAVEEHHPEHCRPAAESAHLRVRAAFGRWQAGEENHGLKLFTPEQPSPP
jgi:hypothetical protein